VFVNGQNSVAIVREKIFVPELAIIPYEHEDEAVRCARHPQAHAGFRSEFDPARFTSMAHGPTVAVVSQSTSSGATVGNRVRPGSMNSLSSRTSWGTQPRRQETLGQRSHPNFRKGTLNRAVVNLSLLSEKHCRVICAVLQVTLLFAGTYDGMSFGSTIARINYCRRRSTDECNQGELNDVS
jgi:hypothetical protein